MKQPDDLRVQHPQETEGRMPRGEDDWNSSAPKEDM